jgi:transcription initiation factor TFIIE subunit alpha
VSFKKKKDEESGWYTYYWKLDQNRMHKMIDEVSEDLIDRFSRLLEREQNTQFFVCGDKCVRIDQDTALGFSFKCPECGQVLKLEDNSNRVEYIQKTLFDIKNVFRNQNS